MGFCGGGASVCAGMGAGGGGVLGGEGWVRR